MTNYELPGLGEPVPFGEPENEVAPEILAHPEVLSAKANDIYSKFHIGHEAYFLTPSQELEIELPDSQVTNINLTLGRSKQSNSGTDLTLYSLDNTNNVLLPWYSFTHRELLSGQGSAVEDQEERLHVRSVLERLESKLVAATYEKISEFSPYEYFKDRLIEEAQGYERLARALRYIDNEFDVNTASPAAKLHVTLKSGWEKEGEKSPTCEYNLAEVGLADAIVATIDHFKELNNRSDLQGAIHVVVEQGSAAYEIPLEVLLPFTRQQGTYAGWEKRTVERLQKAAEDKS
ncbi:MAG TPA: hypothetical protein VG992_02845 [Candidatus Saccharimonadales bacterium]|nr:hypothetical protein [Candidatus Saccharimonadales bacterium]